MKFSVSFSFLVLGAWIGGSACVWGFATYNFLGYDDLFLRNPKLAERAEFDPSDSDAKKASLLWVHSSELNRVVFEYWNLAQMGLAATALITLLLGLGAVEKTDRGQLPRQEPPEAHEAPVLERTRDRETIHLQANLLEIPTVSERVSRLSRLRVTIWLCVLVAGGLVTYGHFWLMPEIVELGRGLDFVPRSPPPEKLGAFGAAHGRYSVVAGVTLALVVASAALALCRCRASREQQGSAPGT